MKPRKLFLFTILALFFSLPIFSKNIVDDNPQSSPNPIPITIVKDTSTQHRSNNVAAVSAFYQSGYVILCFMDGCDGGTVTITNSSNNKRIDHIINPQERIIMIDISEIISVGEFDICILTDSGEVYWGSFVL